MVQCETPKFLVKSIFVFGSAESIVHPLFLIFCFCVFDMLYTEYVCIYIYTCDMYIIDICGCGHIYCIFELVMETGNIYTVYYIQYYTIYIYHRNIHLPRAIRLRSPHYMKHQKSSMAVCSFCRRSVSSHMAQTWLAIYDSK
jgi:hypothetical protein